MGAWLRFPAFTVLPFPPHSVTEFSKPSLVHKICSSTQQQVVMMMFFRQVSHIAQHCSVHRMQVRSIYNCLRFDSMAALYHPYIAVAALLLPGLCLHILARWILHHAA